MPVTDAGLFGLHDDFIGQALEIFFVLLDQFKNLRFGFAVNVPFVFIEYSSVSSVF